MTVFAERLRKLRKDKCLSQAELAKELGMAANTVSIWELGKRMPEKTTIRQIAEFFLTTEEYLLGQSEFSDLDSMIEELRRLKETNEIGNIDEDERDTELLLIYKDFMPEVQSVIFIRSSGESVRDREGKRKTQEPTNKRYRMNSTFRE